MAITQIKIGSGNAQDIGCKASNVSYGTNSNVETELGNKLNTSHANVVASNSQLGHVKIGTNININSGAISVNNGSTSTKGLVKVGTNISCASDSTISVADATTSVKGVVQLNNTYTSTSTSLAATARALKDAYDTLNSKISNSVSFKSTATGSYIQWDIPSGYDSNYYANKTFLLHLIYGVGGGGTAYCTLLHRANIKSYNDAQFHRIVGSLNSGGATITAVLTSGAVRVNYSHLGGSHHGLQGLLICPM